MDLNCTNKNDNFSRFIGFEICPVKPDCDQDEHVMIGCDPAETNMWTLYGRNRDGEAEAIHDCLNPEDAGAALTVAMKRLYADLHKAQEKI